MNIQERVRRELAKQEKARKAAEHKAGESSRRSHAARMSYLARADQRIEDLISGKVQPRNAREMCIALGDSSDEEFFP